MMDLRSRFPLLVSQPDLVYLDSASSTQRVNVALEAVDQYYRTMNANVHRGLYPLSEKATTEYEAVRSIVQCFVNAPSERTVVFTRGTTEGLNMVARCWAEPRLEEGDEIVLTILEHHSNLVPWQLVAERTGARLVFVELTDEGTLDMDAMESAITKQTRLVAVTGLSNALGTVVDLEHVVSLSRKVGARVCVDAAQLAAHFPIDVQALDVDFLAFSAHKLYGPTGAGALYAKSELLEEMEPWMGGGDMIREVHLDHSTWNDVPWKFEAGTPPIAQVIGMGAALKFLMEVGLEKVMAHDRELMEDARERLGKLDFVTVLGPDHNVGSLSFVIQNVHSHDVAAILAESGVCVRAGHHCCMPLMKVLGVTGTTRVSFGVYNKKSDVDRLVEGLRNVRATFG